jgi:molecular chaperone DnaK
MSEQGEQVPDDLKTELEGKIAATRSAMEGQDLAHLEATVQELSESLQKVGAAMYQQPESPPPGDEEPGQPQDDDEDIVDGEFSEA